MPHVLPRRAVLRRLSLAFGALASAPLAPGLFAGCRTPNDLAAYTYQVLSAPQRGLLAALVDEVIPATDTPGAADAGVPQFIDLMLTDWYAPGERDAFLAGLDDVDRQSEGGSFVGLDADARTALAIAMDARAYASPTPAPALDPDVAEAAQSGSSQAQSEAAEEVAGMQGDLGEAQDSETAPAVPFFRQLKELTLAGYYTSEIGATEELNWTPAPGRFDPAVPFTDDDRADAALPWT